MGVSLLKNLGIDEKIIHALQKTYGEDLKGVDLEQEDDDLKLLVKCRKDPDHRPHVMTIHHFFEGKGSSSVTVAKANIETVEGTYNCQDVLEFLLDNGTRKGNLRINGQEIRLADAQSRLLRYLAEELKKTPLGWVFFQDLKEKGLIHGYQSINRLRVALAPYLLKKNPQDFIESNGRKQYRVSLSPDKITLLDKGEKAAKKWLTF